MIRKSVYYIDRKTNTKKKEEIYGEALLSFLYSNYFFTRALAFIIAHIPLLSHLYGFWQSCPWTKRKIRPFVTKYKIDSTEFEKPLESYLSFNDFFCRKLKKSVRPILAATDRISAPADGRYLVIPQIDLSQGFYVKGQKFSLEKLLRSATLAQKYSAGAMVIARLCPTDYHRFHFPLDGIADQATLLNGPLWSVNPLAAYQNIHLFSENKRMITSIENEKIGQYLYIEVGATNVGSIHQTYLPHVLIKKGEEKGFFSFGGSSVILLFPPNTILFDEDLIRNSEQQIETLILVGESLGKLR